MRKKLVLIGGIAGSGKSTIAHHIATGYPFVYADKDNVTRPLMEALLVQNGQAPEDRESKVYINKIRPYEYEQFIDTLFHLLENNYIIGAAPFLKEFQDAEWLLDFQEMVNKRGDDLIIIWVNTDVHKTKERLKERDEKRDYFKLDNFEEYAKGIEKVNKNIINLLTTLQNQKMLKTYFVDNFDGSIEETFDKIDLIIYDINEL